MKKINWLIEVHAAHQDPSHYPNLELGDKSQ
jgi:hypothetical protein